MFPGAVCSPWPVMAEELVKETFSVKNLSLPLNTHWTDLHISNMVLVLNCTGKTSFQGGKLV